MSFSSPTYLYCNRHGVFYFRVVIPVQFRKYFIHKREIKRSLKTENKHLALKLARKYMVDFDKLLTEIKNGDRRVSELITLKDVKLANGASVGEMTIDADDPKLENEMLMNLLNSSQNGEQVKTPVQANLSDSTPKLTLEDVCKLYCEEKQIKDWSAGTYKDNRAIFDLLITLLGEGRIFKGIQRQDLTDAKQKIMKLPANMNKVKKYRGKSVSEILKMKNVVPMSVNSIDKYLKRISALFTWAYDERYISENIGLKLAIGSANNVAREPYTDQDLKKIFLAENLDGFKEPFKFWVPIIALYTGARLNEICQLYLLDIKVVEGINVLEIQDEQFDQSLKTKAANRIVPIHSAIIELGFLEYVDFLKENKQDRLFPELNCHPTKGFGFRPSKWFQDYNKKVGTHVLNKKVFHSFRNTFIDHLKQEEVDKRFVAAIVGHEDPSITFGHYAQDYKPKLLSKYVQLVDYGLSFPDFDVNKRKADIEKSWRNSSK